MERTDVGVLQGYEILVVDDEEDVRTYLLVALADAGARIREAASGEEALAETRTRPPDLITLDLALPDQDGIGVFQELREDPTTRDVPVCIVTGRPELRSLIYEKPVAPPDGFLSKPLRPEQLVSTVRRILELGRRRRDRSAGEGV